MKRLHLIFITLILCGDTKGFTVWNRTPVVDWQAGPSNTSWNQKDQLSTPVQPSKLLAGRGANVKGGSFSSVWPISEVQTAQRDPSFVQSSGDSASDVSVLYSQHQGDPTIQRQDKLTSGPTRLNWLWSLDPVNNGTLVSQSQSAANTHLVYGSQTQSSVPSMANPVTAGQFAVAQSLGTSYSSQTPGRFCLFQGQVSTPPSQVFGFQTQPSYQPGTTTHVSKGQAVSTSQALPSGVSKLNQGLTSGRYLTSMDQTVPSSSQSAVPTGQMSAFPTSTSYQPIYTTQVLTGQSASIPLPQSSDASVYEWQASSWHNSLDQSVAPSIQSVVGTNQIYGSHTDSTYQPSSPAQISTGQSPISQVPFSSRAESLENAKWYTVMPPHTISASFLSLGSENQISGFQTQSSNQPTLSQVLAGQSTIAEFLVGSDSYQTSGKRTILQGQPSPSHLSGFQTQSAHQPSTTTTRFLAGQPASTSQAQSSGSSMLNQVLTSRRNVNSMGQTIPSSSQSEVPTSQISAFQPSTATGVSPGGYAVAQSLAASYPNQMSGRHTIFQGQSSPSSFQIPVFQTQSEYQPSTATQVLTGPSASISLGQSSDVSMLNKDSTSSRNQMFDFQTVASYQPRTDSSVLEGHSASASQAQFAGASMLNQGLPSGRFLALLCLGIPFSSQPAVQTNQMSVFPTAASYQPSTDSSVLQGHSASRAQSSGASMSNQGPTSDVNLTSLSRSVPSAYRSAVPPSLPSSFQASSYQPSTPPQISTGQSPRSRAPFSSRAESSENAKWYTILHPQTISASFPSVGISNQISGFQTQLSIQPSAPTWFSADQTATSQAQSSGASMLNRGLSSSRYLTSLGGGISSVSKSAATSNQVYGSPTSSYQPITSFLPGHFVSPAAPQSMVGSQKVVPN